VINAAGVRIPAGVWQGSALVCINPMGAGLRELALKLEVV